jgi:hypothetical protein
MNPSILSSLSGLFSLPAFPTISPSCIFSHPDFHALMQSLFFIVGTYLFSGITNNSGLFNLSIVFARGISYFCILGEAVLVHGYWMKATDYI